MMPLHIVLLALTMASALQGRDTIVVSVRGNDGAKPGERLHVGQTTRLIAEVLVSYGATLAINPGPA